MTNHLPQLVRDKHLMALLENVMDPELHIPITDMGLIYGAELTKEKNAIITMTLTTVGCPLFDVIKEEIEDALLSDKTIKRVAIELVFDPPWHPGMMSEEQQTELGLL